MMIDAFENNTNNILYYYIGSYYRSTPALDTCIFANSSTKSVVANNNKPSALEGSLE